MTKDKGDLGTTLRAGRALLGAIFTRTGPRMSSRRRIFLPLAMLGVAGIGAGAGAQIAGSAGDVPAADRARIEAVVRDYILGHPEIIPEAMERLRTNEMTKSVSENRKDIVTPYAGAWEGAADGDVVLVEFFDYACSYCRHALTDVSKLLADDRKLKVVYRELPILGDESILAARVAMLAAESNRYPAFHKAMYSHDEVSKATIAAAATDAGLDKAKVQAILASRGTSDEFAKNIALAQALNARGTPLFVVGCRAW